MPITQLRPDELTQKLLEEMGDEQFRLLIQTVATMFSRLKVEAERRGVWEELRTIQKKTDVK